MKGKKMSDYIVELEVIRGYSTRAGYQACLSIHSKTVAFQRHFANGHYGYLVRHAQGQPWGEEAIQLLNKALTEEEKSATKEDYCKSLNPGWT